METVKAFRERLDEQAQRIAALERVVTMQALDLQQLRAMAAHALASRGTGPTER